MTIKETSILFTDRDIFGDDLEHEYDCECHDGMATGHRTDDEDTSAPETITITYPKMESVINDEEAIAEVRSYRGLDTSCELHYGDIMVKYGKITKNN